MTLSEFVRARDDNRLAVLFIARVEKLPQRGFPDHEALAVNDPLEVVGARGACRSR